MKISFNASAVLANNSLTRNDNRLQDSLARLSSGLKIVNAKDNPSGLAMSKRMNAQIEGINQATQNSGDGISIIEIADGTLSEIHDILQRINELAVKSSTGTLTDDDRKMINDEAQQLMEEVERMANEAEFNGQNILDGSFDLKGYTDKENVKMTYCSENMKAGDYDYKIDVTYNDDGTIAKAETADGEISHINGNSITVTRGKDSEVKLHIEPQTGQTAGTVYTVDTSIQIENFGAMDMQIGANEGQQLSIKIPKISLENIGISGADLSTQEGAADVLSKMGDAVKFISSVRSRLGAYQNRLEHTINSLDITNENMTAAYSRIMDVDMAEEMTEYTTVQVLSQASTSMLAQANERPAQVLQLLQ